MKTGSNEKKTGTTTHLKFLLAAMGRKVLETNKSKKREYDFVWSHLYTCNSILDVGCGVGLFFKYAPDRITGIDINPSNVRFCESNGYNALVGDALNIQFGDNTFDGVHSSHVMHIFNSEQAMVYIKELCRVCKPGGRIVVTTKHDSKHFWIDPENSRPYPPSVFYSYSIPQASKEKPRLNPMWEKMPQFEPIDITYRRPPLFYFSMYGSRNLLRISMALNIIQCKIGLKKYWTFDAYTIVLLNQKTI